MTQQKEYYQILGVSRDSTEEEIKKAFRQQALKYHPDRNQEPGADAKFKEINEAYQVLSDPEKSKLYDQYGYDWQNGRFFCNCGWCWNIASFSATT